MEENPRPPSKPTSLRFILGVALVLLATLALGIGAHRLYVWNSMRLADPRLFGEWATVEHGPHEETVLHFHQDATYDFTQFRTTDSQRVRTAHVSHRYRAVDRDTIQMQDPFHGWITRRLKFENDEVTLLYGGEVWRLKRQAK